MNDFFNDIKPYFDLLSQWKRTLTLPSDTSREVLKDFRDIHRRYIGECCDSCRISPVMNALIGHYERAKKRGRKRVL